jgi:hypothetical protein
MPQLIAMVIVVVGAMIYMFQTFGGTGDKIEGVAQKASVITEVNNIRNGLQLALRGGSITTTTTLVDLASLGYFANQINDELKNNTGTVTMSATANINKNKNTYSAISFGGEDNPSVFISMVVGAAGTKPGIRVQFTGSLATNAGFLETQIANDLQAIASIDRTTVDGSAVTLLTTGDVPVANRPTTVKDSAGNAGTVASGTATLTDGVFTIYFKDMPATIQ